MASDTKGPGGIERRRYPDAVPGDPQYDRRAPGSGGRRSTDWGSWTRPLSQAAAVAEKAPALPRILVVCDSDATRNARRQALSDLPAEILEASTSEEGLRLAMEHDFALIVADSHMREVDGFGLLAALRGEKRTATTPVILTMPTADSRRQGYRSGAVDCLVEAEIDPEMLRQKARAFLAIYAVRTGLLGRVQRLEAEKRELETKLQTLQLQRKEQESPPDAAPAPSGAG